jgi:serine O-acetyltransferase
LGGSICQRCGVRSEFLATLDAHAGRVLGFVESFKSFACLPVAWAVRWSDARDLVEGDVAHWLAVLGAGDEPAVQRIATMTGVAVSRRGKGVSGLHRLLYAFPEFRAVYYHRLIRGNALGALAGRALRFFCRPVAGLSLLTADIGPGLFVAHGTNTVLAADRIGSNCYVHQGVTVGWDYKSERKPIIGDGVFIGAGAVILGAVTIGDFARIGANSVVLCDVPAWSTAAGAPARVVSMAEAVATTG